jgi:hypothetical protein
MFRVLFFGYFGLYSRGMENNGVSLTDKMISIRISSKSGLSQNGFTNWFQV